jgi:hypothetical protein
MYFFLALHRVYTFACAYKSFQQGTCFFIVGHSNNIFVCDDVGNGWINKTLLLIKHQKWLSEFCVKIDRVASKN